MDLKKECDGTDKLTDADDVPTQQLHLEHMYILNLNYINMTIELYFGTYQQLSEIKYSVYKKM